AGSATRRGLPMRPDDDGPGGPATFEAPRPEGGRRPGRAQAEGGSVRGFASVLDAVDGPAGEVGARAVDVLLREHVVGEIVREEHADRLEERVIIPHDVDPTAFLGL